MKKKLLGLGICALALGAFAGAFSAQRALEAEAAMPSKIYLDVTDVKWFFNDSAKAYAKFDNDGTENGTEMTYTHMSSVYSIDVPNGATKVTLNRVKPDGSEVWNTSNAIDLADGKNYLNFKDESGIKPETWAEFISPVAAIVGIGDWDVAHAIEGTPLDPNEGNYLFKWESQALTYTDQFKIAAVGNRVYWDSVLGYSSLCGTAASRFETPASDNIKLKGTEDSHDLDGNYNIYVNKSGKAVIENPGDPMPADYGYYVLGNEAFAGSGKDWRYTGGKKMSNPTDAENNLAELINVQVANGAKVKARSYLTDVDAWYNAGVPQEEYSFAEIDGEGNISFTKAGAYNFFLNKEGKLWVAEYQEPVADVYKAYLDGVELGTLTENPNTPGEFMLASADLVAGKELTFKLNGEALSVGAKDGAKNNVEVDEGKLIVRMTNSGGIYLSQVESNWVVWVDGFLDADFQAVDDFVATYITPYIDNTWEGQDADTRSASCKEKYDRAQPHYAALSQEQKDLFDSNARYGEAKVAYLTWQTVATQGGVMSVTNLNNSSNTGLIVTLVAIAGAAIAGASIFFALRKKKNNN